MNVSHDSLIVNMDLFREATGKMSIEIFSNKKFNNQYYSRWVLKKDASIQKEVSINFNGPSSFFDADWMPRVELTDYVGHDSVLGLRPDDSYFLIKNVQPDVLQLTLKKAIGNLAAEFKWWAKEPGIALKTAPMQMATLRIILISIPCVHESVQRPGIIWRYMLLQNWTAGARMDPFSYL